MSRHLFVLCLLCALLAACSANGSSVGSGSASVIVVNASGDDLCRLYVSSSVNTTWTDERLGVRRLDSGGQMVVNVLPGQYDLRAERCAGGEAIILLVVDVQTSYTWNITAPPAPDATSAPAP